MTPDDEDFDGDFEKPLSYLLPPDALPMYGFLVAVYMDPDSGEVFDEYYVVGKATLRDSLGTLDAVKFRLCMAQYAVRREDDE